MGCGLCNLFQGTKCKSGPVKCAARRHDEEGCELETPKALEGQCCHSEQLTEDPDHGFHVILQSGSGLGPSMSYVEHSPYPVCLNLISHNAQSAFLWQYMSLDLKSHTYNQVFYHLTYAPGPLCFSFSHIGFHSFCLCCL